MLLTGAAVATATAQSTAPQPTATVISPDGVNFRSSPSTAGNVLDVLPFGSTVTLTGAPAPDGWYPVSAGSQAGWVSGAYIAAGALSQAAARVATPLFNPPAVLSPSGASASAGAVPLITYPNPTPGSSYQETASYYGVDDTTVPGTMMDCGAPFDPYDTHAAATDEFSCGTKLLVTAPNGKQIQVVVTDHGFYRAHWMDLTYAAFGLIADHPQGVVQVTVQVLP